MSLLSKILGDPNKKELDKLQPLVEQMNSLEPETKKLSDEQLKAKSTEFKEELKQGKTLDDILPDTFAVVREAARRTTKMRPFDAQLLGAVVLHQGKIAEMKTGEGKTLVATMPIYLNALTGKGAHVVTVNDYLARRDTVWMGQVYHALGLSVGCIQHEAAFLYNPEFQTETEVDKGRDGQGAFKVEHQYLQPVSRQEAYQADITYGTNNEFGFDYLRDNMVLNLEDKVQRELNYAIIDEVDSILIDEARTPLIISAPAEQATQTYFKFAQLVKQLKENKDYNIDEKMRAATLTEEGIKRVEKMLGLGNIYQQGGIQIVHHLENALKANTLFKRDRDYIVREGEVIIVDEFTGRLMFGRRFSEGLHQAIEAKEGVEIKQESCTLATITFQNLFRLYNKLAGMTGTAVTEAEEFHKIYDLDVVVVPTNKPMIRENLTDLVYKNEDGKFKAVVEEIKKRQAKGQPQLVGTISIEKNERLSFSLEREGIEHNLLNAKNHEKEAEIIAQAGRIGAVTIATNMAGRGVDIVLGGNPPDPEEQKKIIKLGGLHVLGTERHEARRIDNQLRGRSGRQGDPGSSQFYVSLDDDLMRIFGSERMKSVMNTLRVPDDMPIENKMIAKSIEAAQKKVEGHNFDIRKHLLEYDDVLNKHREIIYQKRNKILQIASRQKPPAAQNLRADKTKDENSESKNLQELIFDYLNKEIEAIVSFHTGAEDKKQWDFKEIYEVVNTIFPIAPEARLQPKDIRTETSEGGADASARTLLIEYLKQLAQEAYQQLEQEVGFEHLRQLEKALLLRAIDTMWIEHLEAMAALREGIGLRGYGQRDPLIEYKKEAFQMFSELNKAIQAQIVYSVYKLGLAQKMAASPMQAAQLRMLAPEKTMAAGKPAMPQPAGWGQPVKEAQSPAPSQPKRKLRKVDGTKVGRNDPCPCGATKPDGTPIKYKHCHGK